MKLGTAPWAMAPRHIDANPARFALCSTSQRLVVMGRSRSLKGASAQCGHRSGAAQGFGIGPEKRRKYAALIFGKGKHIVHNVFVLDLLGRISRVCQHPRSRGFLEKVRVGEGRQGGAGPGPGCAGAERQPHCRGGASTLDHGDGGAVGRPLAVQEASHWGATTPSGLRRGRHPQ